MGLFSGDFKKGKKIVNDFTTKVDSVKGNLTSAYQTSRSTGFTSRDNYDALVDKSLAEMKKLDELNNEASRVGEELRSLDLSKREVEKLAGHVSESYHEACSAAQSCFDQATFLKKFADPNSDKLVQTQKQYVGGGYKVETEVQNRTTYSTLNTYMNMVSNNDKHIGSKITSGGANIDDIL